MVCASASPRARSIVLTCSLTLLSCSSGKSRMVVANERKVAPKSDLPMGGQGKKLPERSMSSRPPKPMLQIEPFDLTSMTTNGALRVSLRTVTTPPSKTILEKIAGQVRLVELKDGTSVPATTEIHEAQPHAYSDLGYPTSLPAFIAVKPSAPLNPDLWYELQVFSVPDEVVAARIGLHNLDGGGVSARFSPGSHPTLASVRRCRVEDGTASVYFVFSENIRADERMKANVILASEEGEDCRLTLPRSGLARTLHFQCTGGSGIRGRFHLSVRGATESPSGGKLEIPRLGRSDFSTSVTDDMWKEYDEACSILAF
jgi:hypothetical protein